MFDDLFHSMNGVQKFYDILHGIKYLNDNLQEEFLKEKDCKNAAIEAIVKILESHKD